MIFILRCLVAYVITSIPPTTSAFGRGYLDWYHIDIPVGGETLLVVSGDDVFLFHHGKLVTPKSYHVFSWVQHGSTCINPSFGYVGFVPPSFLISSFAWTSHWEPEPRRSRSSLGSGVLTCYICYCWSILGTTTSRHMTWWHHPNVMEIAEIAEIAMCFLLFFRWVLQFLFCRLAL
jgi:hypothetical protein